MKILISGDMNEKTLKELGKFLVERYKGKVEHINMLVMGLENKSLQETQNILREMWER